MRVLASRGALAVVTTGQLSRHLVTPPDHGLVLGPLDSGPGVGKALRASTRLCIVPEFFVGPGLGGLVQRLRAVHPGSNLRILVEVLHPKDLSTIEEAGADGVVARGQDSGGWGGDCTSFMLLQALAGLAEMPCFAMGGLSPDTLPSAGVAGVYGCVFGPESWGMSDAPWSADVRKRLAGAVHGQEIVLWEGTSRPVRVLLPRASSAAEALRKLEERSGKASLWERVRWTVRVLNQLGLSPEECLTGQDATLAPLWSGMCRDTGSMIRTAMRLLRAPAGEAVRELVGEASPLARSHGTGTPFVQGPMTRVSDSPDFAIRVAEAGALPMLALALMRPQAVRRLMDETATQAGGRPWGVGMLGFIDPELYEAQVREVKRRPPPFAMIAGGRPEQIQDLETSGIPTYVHAPSAGLLTLLLEGGARRFVWEGRECGGHIGPTTSFVLWSLLTEALLSQSDHMDLEEVHVLLAGGIHDGLGLAMAAAAAGRLAQAGCRVGFLMGTAYLFTHEIVETGALCADYQANALQAETTRLLRSSPGHVVRCLPSPFQERFEQTKREWREQGVKEAELNAQLEEMNIGRLRIAAKGVVRRAEGLHDVDATERWEQGVYMIGQAAQQIRELRHLGELHRELLTEAAGRLGVQEKLLREDRGSMDIAIVGMDGLFPGANGAEDLWQQVFDLRDCIQEVPSTRWDWREWYDEDRSVPDKVYGRWGGFLEAVNFEPSDFGMPPASLKSIEPLQLLTLLVARRMLDSYGPLRHNPSLRDTTSVILGITGGLAELGQRYVLRSGRPEGAKDGLPEWTEDSFAGTLMNVTAGRIANRLDLHGTNYTVDAACASSLTAIYLACQELRSGASDLVLTGGADTFQSPFNYLCFAKTQALSPGGKCRTFDQDADGTCLSEGVGLILLKRLEDAERDGDAVLGVIRGVAGSSDGKAKGLTAPHPQGQMRCLERAYRVAGVLPSSVGLVEAHGTGTLAGDRSEIESLTAVFGRHHAPSRSAALGSIKSNIGHTKGAAGVAGIIKAVEAMRRGVLPATLHVQTSNPALERGPFYASTLTRPWLNSGEGKVRRAGVSGFGFGGTNFHAVLEEAPGTCADSPVPAASQWPAELVVFAADSQEDLQEQARTLAARVEASPGLRLADLARGCWREQSRNAGIHRFATLAADRRELLEALWECAGGAGSKPGHWGPVPETPPRVAFLFPGQGAQQPNMMLEAAVWFPEVRHRIEQAERALADCWEHPLSRYLFPPVDGGEEDVEALARTDRAQAALGAVCLGLMDLLAGMGLTPEATAGHSYGEFTALVAAGAIPDGDLPALSAARGRYILEEAGSEGLGRMLAVLAGEQEVAEALGEMESVWIANINGPRQTILSAPEDRIFQVREQLESAGLDCVEVAVRCGFHSPLVAPARDRLKGHLEGLDLRSPRIPVYGNTHARPYPEEITDLRYLLTDHLVSPVRFEQQVRNMRLDGVDWFVEVGPRTILSRLCGSILGEDSARIFSLDVKDQSFLLSLQRLLAEAWLSGLPVNLDRLTSGRSACDSRDAALSAGCPSAPSAACWKVDGGFASPLGAPRNHASWPPAPPASPTLMNEPQSPRVPSSLLSDHQELMSRFLETHRQVMMAALGSASPVESSVVPAPAKPVARNPLPVEPGPAPMPEPLAVEEKTPDATATLYGIVAASTGYPESVLNPEMDLEKELGVDSIKRVEIVGKLRKEVPGLLEAPSPSSTRSLGEILAWAEAHTAGVVTKEPAVEPAAPSCSSVREQILRIVSERTGYPPEMMDPSANLESELGIDSIKRVEIAGMIRKTFPDHPVLRDAASSRVLSSCGCLRDMFDLLENGRPGEADSSVDAGCFEPCMEESVAEPEIPAEEGAPRPLARFQMIPLPIPKLIERVVLISGGIYLLTGEDREMMGHLSSLISRGGGRPEHLDLAGSTEEVASRVKGLRESGQIQGWIHAEAPFSWSSAQGMGEGRVREVPVAVMALARELAEDFSAGGRILFSLPDETHRDPAQGSLIGFLNTLSVEWEAAACRTVETEGGGEVRKRAEILFDELCGKDHHPHVLIRGDERFALHADPVPLHPTDPRDMIVGEDVIWLTGGARGITAQVARHLARQRRCKLVLSGRTPEPSEVESPETASLFTENELRAHWIASEAHATPREVEQAVQACLRDREIRETLREIRGLGVDCIYLQGDIADTDIVERQIQEILSRTGRLDVVIHGAGVIEDRLVSEKDPESVVRVFQPKLMGACHLASGLRGVPVRDLILFSSVAAYGNRGQADYAAANWGLHDLAASLNREGDLRCRAVLWGPWKGGMAGEEVQRMFRERGVQVIDPVEGSDWLLQELECSETASDLMIAGDGPWFRPGWPRACCPESAALLTSDQLRALPDGSREAIVDIDPATSPYLLDHVLDGNPVLPAAMAMELMFEVAVCANPGWRPQEMREVHVLRGVVLEEGRPTRLRVRQRYLEPERATDFELALQVELADPDHPNRLLYRAQVVLVRRRVDVPEVGPDAPADLVAFPKSRDEAYRDWLFHGELFAGVQQVHGLSDAGISARLETRSPERLLREPHAPFWILDPVLVDSAFQLSILWERWRFDQTPLPTQCASIHLYSEPVEGPVECLMTTRPGADSGQLDTDIHFRDATENCFLVMRGMAFTCTPDLNRLAGKDGGGA